MRCDFVSVGVQIADLGVIGPLVRDVEGGGDGAAVGIFASSATALEQFAVQILVQVVDGVVEGQQHHLRYRVDRQVTWMTTPFATD